ncbi:hypothetical protein CNY89_30045, partial [Amaricoccus sp. HAR-UPW-R2A-40]
LTQDPARNLILAPFFAERIESALPALRQVVAEGALRGHALTQDPARNLILAPFFAERIESALPALRQVVAEG